MESNVPIYLFNQPRMKTLLVQKWQELMRLRVIREPIGGMTRHYMGGSNSPSIFQTTRRTSYVLRYVNPAQLTFARTKCTARLTARRQIDRKSVLFGTCVSVRVNTRGTRSLTTK